MKAAFPLVLLALVAFGCSNGIDQAREDAVGVVDSIVWPDGYETDGSTVLDPSNALSQGRSGNVNTGFEYQGESEAELMANFHESLSNAGFVVRDDFPNRCEPGRVSIGYWHAEHEVGATTLSFSKFEESGRSSLLVSVGWGTRGGADFTPPVPGELPECV